MTTINGNGNPPMKGTLVLTSDGSELGRVKEISGSCFKVDAPMARDYWLASDAVRDSSGSAVVLNVDKKSLDEVKIDQEEHTGSHVHRSS